MPLLLRYRYCFTSFITNTLCVGLERLSASFPWLTGQIVNEDSGEGNSGTFKIKSLGQIPRMVVKDLILDSSMASMDALRQANFPFSMLDESVIAPCKALPGGAEESAYDSPVFLLQLSYIKGGILLTLVGHHQAMDMIGQGHIIHLLSKACHNEQFTREELSSGNLLRRDLVPLLPDDPEEQDSLTRQLEQITLPHPTSSATNDDAISSPIPKCTWAYFTFKATSLSALKSLATKTIAPASDYIFTDDALSAFIWQSISRARLSRLDPSTNSTFARAVDIRHRLAIPATYPGLMQNMTYHTTTLQALLEAPLGTIASELRSALTPPTTNLGPNTHALVTSLKDTADKSQFSFTAKLDLSVDVMLSSWAKVNSYELDFNLGLGKPEAVRRPRFDPVESLVCFMPRRLDGEVVVGLCLREEDLRRLRADGGFMRLAVFVG